MYLTPEIKKDIFEKHGKSSHDSGSPESQIALFTLRINYMTGLLKKHKKDKVTQRSLVNLVGKRRRLLNYLKSKDIEKYRSLIKELGIRK